MHPVSCNLCQGDDTVFLVEQRGFRIVRCRECGLVYVNPRPATEELASLYGAYHARDGADEAAWDRLMRPVFGQSADLLCSLRAGVGRPRLLDVGCGFGGFVDLMGTQGWDAEGVDPSASVVAAATRRGRRVRLGTLEDLPPGHGPFDAVTMFYVLEHLADPLGALRKAFGLLIGGGTLLVRVPHTTPIVRLLAPVGLDGGLYDPPFHLYDFSPTVLRKMLLRIGFDDIQTFPGRPTVPTRRGPRVIASLFGSLAAGLHAVTRGAALLPGVSKTTVARKPSR